MELYRALTKKNKTKNMALVEQQQTNELHKKGNNCVFLWIYWHRSVIDRW